MRKNNGVNHSMRVPVRTRRREVLNRLEAQLKLGSKNIENSKEHGVEALTESDIKRINREILTLKKRI